MNSNYYDSRTPEERANEPKGVITTSSTPTPPTEKEYVKIHGHYPDGRGTGWEREYDAPTQATTEKCDDPSCHVANIPGHGHTTDTGWDKTEQQLMDLLHEFNRENLEEPFDGEPLMRRARKWNYARQIIEIFQVKEALETPSSTPPKQN